MSEDVTPLDPTPYAGSAERDARLAAEGAVFKRTLLFVGVTLSVLAVVFSTFGLPAIQAIDVNLAILVLIVLCIAVKL